jgi:small-conductance mechanosensitive channel
VSATTLDGTSFLIPNDELITKQVVNWSFSGPGVRLKIPVGVAYGSDVRQAMDLMVAAALEFPRVLRDPQPTPRLMKFADSAIQLELRLWIKDPDRGVTNIKSDIQLKIWELYNQHGVEFPFPQQDLHLKSPAEFTVRLKGPEEPRDA